MLCIVAQRLGVIYNRCGGDSVGKASTRAQNKWIEKTYDRINLTVPKGDKEKIATAAAAAGQSVNAFINEAIKARIEKGR